MKGFVSSSVLAVLIELMTVLIGRPATAGPINGEPRAYLTAFKERGDPNDLLRAIAAVNAAPVQSEAEELAKQISLLESVAFAYDPKFDREPPQAVQAHVMPPMGYDSGVSPDSIADPLARADYEKRIAANATIARRQTVQTAVRGVMDRLLRRLLANPGGLQGASEKIAALGVSEGVKEALLRKLQDAQKK